MLNLIALAVILEGVRPDHAQALSALIAEHREENSGDPYVKAQAAADLNNDGLVDGVIVFSYTMGSNMDHTHTEFLTIAASSPEGYVASWPTIVGARGFRNISRVEIDGTEIILRGDFSVSDETASMATLPATGEIHYSYEGGKLRERRVSWTRKPD